MTEIKRKYFGTDGIRGRVGVYPITPDFVLKLGWAAGHVLCNKNSAGKIIIGKDTRISGYMFESALEAGLSAAGVNTFLLGPMPTPAVAFLTRDLRAQAGIVISASHNAYHDNGIKFFAANGQKLPDKIELQIEQQIDKVKLSITSDEIGKVTHLNDATTRYIEFCKNIFPQHLSLQGIKLVVDCANGATYHAAPQVMRELGAEVFEIGVSPDGFNINEYCGATKPETLKKIVLAEQADLGIALDGDGDRLIMVDNKGELVDGDEAIFIIAKYLQQQNKFAGGVVGTLMSNLGMEIALKNLGIDLVRSQVGDRYVMEKLLQLNWILGGESSGHIIYRKATTTGDGIISALLILTVIMSTETSLYDLKKGMQKLPQILINVKVKNKQCLENTTIQKAKDAAIKKLKDQGRILLRPSGTEPVVRVMVEGYDKVSIEKIAQDLAAIITAAD